MSRVAIVTGAANGIGRAIAERLLSEDWRVAALDLPSTGLSQLKSQAPERVAVVEADVAQEETATRAVAAALNAFGRIDGLVSNAGKMIRKSLANLTLDEWRQVIDVNLTATFLLAREAEHSLRAAKGAIVTIASTRALMSEPDTESYSASKGGLVALTHALAISLGPDVRANCISPGWIKTKDYAGLCPSDHDQHPAGRVGKPEDIAEVAAWLLDGARSGFVTGANVVVDGGMTRKMIYQD